MVCIYNAPLHTVGSTVLGCCQMLEVEGVAWGGGLPWADFKRRTILFPSLKEQIFIVCPLLHCIYTAGHQCLLTLLRRTCPHSLAVLASAFWGLKGGATWISVNATSGTQSKANFHPPFLARAVPAFSVVEGSLRSLMTSASGRPLPLSALYLPL